MEKKQIEQITFLSTSEKVTKFESEFGSTFSIVESKIDRFKECECCKMSGECYKTLSLEGISWNLCHECLYKIQYGEE